MRDKDLCKINKSGFSLIELLVVVAIIGALASIGTIAYNGYVDGARKTAAQNAMQQIALMQTEYYSIVGEYYGEASCTPSAANTSAINTNLFDGAESIDVEKYWFCAHVQTESGSQVGYVVKACNISGDACGSTNLTLNAKGENNF